MTPHPRSAALHRGAALCGVIGLSLALVACAGSPSPSTSSAPPTTAAPQAPTAAASASASASSENDPAWAVPGYAVGEIPPVPLFTLPDLGLLTSSTGRFTPDLTTQLTSRPGITVEPARCNEQGVLNGGSTVVGADGSVQTSAGDSTVVNNGAGAAVYHDGQVSIVNNGDGSGSYSDGTTSIVVNGDGSGTYNDPTLSVVASGGTGTYNNSATGESIVVAGNGTGTYSTDTVSIVNNGDGSGTYSDSEHGLSIINNGDGTAVVSTDEGTRTVKAERLAPVGRVGSFPSIDAAKPIEACGTVITLTDGILFDFGSSEVRQEAMTTITELAQLLTQAGVPTAHVYGHTDSVSDDAFNQTLSEQRAQAVAAALSQAGATSSIDSQGFGESRPVAANENPDGSDNPAGRQLNRRVEIYIPTF